jgi:hypothetical protein
MVGRIREYERRWMAERKMGGKEVSRVGEYERKWLEE